MKLDFFSLLLLCNCILLGVALMWWYFTLMMIFWTLRVSKKYIISCFLWYVNFFIQFFYFSRYAGPHFTKIPLLKTPTRLELNGSLDLSRPESINQQIPNMSCKSSTIKPKNNLKVKPKAPMSKEEIKAQQLLKAMGKHTHRKKMLFCEARHFLHHRLSSLIRQNGHKYKTFFYENQILNNTMFS